MRDFGPIHLFKTFWVWGLPPNTSALFSLHTSCLKTQWLSSLCHMHAFWYCHRFSAPSPYIAHPSLAIFGTFHHLIQSSHILVSSPLHLSMDDILSNYALWHGDRSRKPRLRRGQMENEPKLSCLLVSLDSSSIRGGIPHPHDINGLDFS